MGQIFDIRDLACKLGKIRNRKKIVHCHGVFDLLHIGHIRYLKKSKELGDVLVVTITPDKYVNKGPHRPAFPEELRAEALASLECIDYVAINKWPTAVETIHLLKPHIYAKGAEYKNLYDDPTGGIIKEKQAIEDIGGEIKFIEDITFSSSSLINRYFSSLSPQAKRFIDQLKNKYSIDEILEYINKTKKLKVLILGETIIDEYHFCETMGKSGKEPILAARYLYEEKFAGGVLAIANHISSFCDNVTLISFLGRNWTQEEFIKKKLKPNIEAKFLYHPGPTIVKRRFVEKYPFQKLFEIYFMNGLENEEGSEELLRCIRENIDTDLILVADYGHGMMSESVREFLCDSNKFLAINVQVNAGNLGFNTISKYRRADVVCISEKELRMEMRSRNKPIEELIKKLLNKFEYKSIIITRGEKGCVGYSEDTGFIYSPALINSFKDRVGAGDAVLSIVSLLLAVKVPLDVTLFLANCVGGYAVNTMCNRESIDKLSIIKYVISILK